jgi:hypothetical protein
MEKTAPQKPASKNKIYLIIGGVVALAAGIYFWINRKKDPSNTANNAATANSGSGGTSGSTDKGGTGTGGTGTGGTGTGGTTTKTPVISITEVSIVKSPIIGEYHLKAKVNIQNPPASGALEISFNKVNIINVNFPLNDNFYLVDAYVPVDTLIQSFYDLEAKVGNVVRLVTLAP